MSIEAKIEELQRQLAVKTAYLGVKISFGNDLKHLPADVKEEVISKLNGIAVKLAEGVEEVLEQESEMAQLTPQEVSTLKLMADKILNANTAPKPIPGVHDPRANPAPIQAQPVVPPQPQVKRAEIMTTGSIDPTVRSKVDSQSVVTIVSLQGDNAFVQDTKYNRFWIPVEDLNFNI